MGEGGVEIIEGFWNTKQPPCIYHYNLLPYQQDDTVMQSPSDNNRWMMDH